MKRRDISRRTVLRGTGVAMGLPLLEAMLPAKAAAQTLDNQPGRMLAYYCPVGMHMPSWTPASTGSNYTLSETLKPLENVKEDLLVLTNLRNLPGKAPGGGDHAAGTGAFLTAYQVNKTQGSDIRNSISLDQVYANEVAGQTPFPSIELGMSGGGTSGDCDSGYSCAYARNISWSGPRTPKPKLTDPRAVFDRLFGQQGTNQNVVEAQRRVALNKSVLDYILEDTKKLQTQLGATDKAKLDEYFTGVEQLEQGLEAVEVSCEAPGRPASNYSLTDKVRIMSDLMVLAFECDSTRAQTFMLDNAASQRNYGFLGVGGDGHHTISHHQGRASNHDKLKKINQWEIEQFAYLLEGLKAKTDIGGKPLLDSCTVFLSSDVSDGDRHNHDKMPVLLAGKANGYFNTGRHLNYGSPHSFGDLFKTMLESMGVKVDKFGQDGNNVIANLKA